ncbi:MAG: DUF2304 family protein [Candidatus Altiarchaeales archaeon]|nr:DUF2304 family protein [Candidatus Altiarchaeales archaeon]
MILPFFQLTGLIALLFFLYYTYIQYRKNIFNKADALIWSVIWVTLMFISVFPQLFQPFIPTLFFRVLDIIVIFSVAALLTVGFLIYRRLRIYEQKTRQLMRHMALEDVEEPG